MEAAVRVLEEFNNKSHVILLDGEYRRSEATESRRGRNFGAEGCICRQARIEMRLRRRQKQGSAWFRILNRKFDDDCNGGLDVDQIN